jgi:hypothetical protein
MSTVNATIPPPLDTYLAERMDYWKPRIAGREHDDSQMRKCRAVFRTGLYAVYGDAIREAERDRIADDFVKQIVGAIRESVGATSGPVTLNNCQINVTVVNVNPPETKGRKLAFQRIDDDALNLTDRVILSLCHQYAYSNSRRVESKKPPKPVTFRRLRKAITSDHRTVKASIDRLRERGYLDGFEPLPKDERYRGFQKLEWKPSGQPTSWDVYDAYVSAITKRHNAAYATKFTGVSRRTYFNRRKRVVLRCTRSGVEMH